MSDTTVNEEAVEEEKVIEEEVQETTDDQPEQEEPEEGEQESSSDEDDGDEDEVFDKSRAMAKIRKVNREAENLRKRLKQAEAAEAELKKIKDSQKSESERLNDRATEAEARVAALQRELDLKTIQAEFGLSEKQVNRLHGDDVDELRQDAEIYIEENNLKKSAKKAGPSANEVSGGRNPRTPKQTLDPAKLAARVRRR